MTAFPDRVEFLDLFPVLFWSYFLMCHVWLSISSLCWFSCSFPVFTCVPLVNHPLFVSVPSSHRLFSACGSWFLALYLFCTLPFFFVLCLLLLWVFTCFVVFLSAFLLLLFSGFGLAALCWHTSLFVQVTYMPMWLAII